MKKLILFFIFIHLNAQELNVEIPRAMLTVNNLSGTDFKILIDSNIKTIKNGDQLSVDLPLKIIPKADMGLGNPAKINPSNVVRAQAVLVSDNLKDKVAFEVSFTRGIILLNNKYKLEANAYFTSAVRKFSPSAESRITLGGYIDVIDKNVDEYTLDALPTKEYYSINLTLKPDIKKSQIDLGIRI